MYWTHSTENLPLNKIILSCLRESERTQDHTSVAPSSSSGGGVKVALFGECVLVAVVVVVVVV